MSERQLESAQCTSTFNELGVRNSIVAFSSITRAFLASKISKELKCPKCERFLNFTKGIRWISPDSFTCGFCDQLIDFRLVRRALKDIIVD